MKKEHENPVVAACFSLRDVGIDLKVCPYILVAQFKGYGYRIGEGFSSENK